MKCPKCPNTSDFKVDAWEFEAVSWYVSAVDGTYTVDDRKTWGSCESAIYPNTAVQCTDCGHEGEQSEFGFDLDTEWPDGHPLKKEETK
jgi:hypothetical protein